ncbi:MAG: hypothetical protein IPF92_16750 [Myxococcales bacterium]|nr:hypothetical protein [Myxococcales bacterium]MBL0195451.1 hypothetical protein [Myxococcales bacterium]HQY60143.1 hypothetical protein [Polyangiaceae bacterium]
MPRRWTLNLALAAALAASATAADACSSPTLEGRRTLEPGPNPFGPGEPLWAPQPHRDHPGALAITPDGRKLYVALEGTEDEPGSEISVVDTASARVTTRIRVGASPSAIAMHPGGSYAVVTHRYSRFASVVDVRADRVVSEVPIPYYTTGVIFTPDGRRAYLANRWKDSVLRWDVAIDTSLRVVSTSYSGAPDDARVGIPVGDNPRDLAVSPDGDTLYVASLTGLSLSVIDLRRDVEVRRVGLGSPPGGVVALGRWVFVTHTGRGSQHPPDEGFDTDGDGKPGDGTANVMFQDLQNEIAVFDATGTLVKNFTSDTICCADFRDVDPAHPERGAALPAPDTWPASRLAFLPPRDTWIVAGALPERMAASGDTLRVVYSGSNEVQSFRIAPDGALSALDRAGKLHQTGMNPQQIVLSPDGARAYVTERLGEHVTVLDLRAGPGAERRIPVGDLSGGPFPATDAELGEGINFVTAKLTVDGDQTCAHCHREGGNIAKAIAMPLQADPVWGNRMVMAYRGAFDTRPWFMEAAMSETNFFPVINEFARKENFCCEQIDPLVWSKYPSPERCASEPGLAGCAHVLDCANNPPLECKGRAYGSQHLKRNAHFLAASKELFGRDHTFGDALFATVSADDGADRREAIPLDFNGVTRALGVFLLQRPRLLPNPNAAIDGASARRGERVYRAPAVGCNTCHPLPLTTVTREFNPSGVPLRFPAVVSPRRKSTGEEVDRVTPGFLQTFPEAQQDQGGVRFGVPQLRGIWDRAQGFFHDGRAPSLREALATPGHPGLRPGERGFNETDGMPDTHGATSTLSAEELDDLVAFLLTL